jgi:CheY-like chemotaxis protein/anti-sigma regulatory factor (Ser/Thr protein kinase)
VREESGNGTPEFQLRILKNISHDIRTNINEIQGYLEFLERRQLEGEDLDHLFHARRATQALRFSVDKLLNFTALNANELELHREWFYLDDLMLDVAEFAAESASHKGLELFLEVETGSRLVYGDDRRLEEMIRYLLENAVKFTERGYIKLKMTREERKEQTRIVITIDDSGIGMSPAELKEVREPYVRFVEGEKGLGLGLYFAQIIAEKMGALLQIDSTPNQGTSVRIELQLDATDIQESCETEALKGKRLAFFTHPELKLHPKVQKLRIETLRNLEVKIDSFCEEEAFSQYLLRGDNIPDIVAVSARPDDYERYGMLFAFLGKSKTFTETAFVAERIGNLPPPKHFNISFERQAGIRSLLEALESRREQRTATDLRILIVDDLVSNIDILKLFLSKIAPDAEIDSAQGGYEAIGMYRNRRYDLIFMDLKMPGLDGFQVLEHFKKIAPLPLCYAITAEVYESTRKEVEVSGFRALLEKPYNAEQLKVAVKEALNEKNH